MKIKFINEKAELLKVFDEDSFKFLPREKEIVILDIDMDETRKAFEIKTITHIPDQNEIFFILGNSKILTN